VQNALICRSRFSNPLHRFIDISYLPHINPRARICTRLRLRRPAAPGTAREYVSLCLAFTKPSTCLPFGQYPANHLWNLSSMQLTDHLISFSVPREGFASLGSTSRSPRSEHTQRKKGAPPSLRFSLCAAPPFPGPPAYRPEVLILFQSPILRHAVSSVCTGQHYRSL